MKPSPLFAATSLLLTIVFCLQDKAMAQSSDIALATIDLGNVSSPGSVTDGNGYYTIQGSGSGVGGTADACQFAYQVQTGDFAFISTVWEQTGGGETGIMVRPSLDPSSSFIEVAYQAGIGTILQYRYANGETAVVDVQDTTFSSAPVQLGLVRSGNSFTAYESDPDGGSWTPLDTLTAPDSWTDSVYLGLVESSDNNSTVATAEVDNLLYLPEVYCSSQDIGHPALVGSTNYNDTAGQVYTVCGGGTGIGGNSDQNRFTFSWSNGNVNMIVRMTGLSASNNSAQGGLMIRESLDASSPQITLALTPNNGVKATWRSTVGGSSTTAQIAPASSTPCWLQLNRTGNTFSVSTSADGVTWSPATSTTIRMSSQVYFGFGVSSANSGSLATATFDNFEVGHQ